MTKYIILGFTCAQVGVLLGVAIGYLLGNKKASLVSMSRAFLNNLENAFIFLSICMIALTILTDIFLKDSGITSIFIYIFGTLIFTWLLTRKSVKSEAKKQEQMLAEKAYKQLNFVEETAKETFWHLQEYIESKDDLLDENEKLVLSRAADGIHSIMSEIKLCTFDWEDLRKDEKSEEIQEDIIKPDRFEETIKEDNIEETGEDEDQEEIEDLEDEDQEEIEDLKDTQAVEYEDKLNKKTTRRSRRNKRKHA